MGAIEELQEARNAIWLEKPCEVKRIRGRKGARNQNFTIMTYAMADARGVVDFLHALRMTAKAENADLSTMVTVASSYLEFHASRYERYYDMVDLPAIIRKTVTSLKQADSISEYLQVIEAFMQLVGKFYFWFDLELPWHELALEYERIKILEQEVATSEGQ